MLPVCTTHVPGLHRTAASPPACVGPPREAKTHLCSALSASLRSIRQAHAPTAHARQAHVRPREARTVFCFVAFVWLRSEAHALPGEARPLSLLGVLGVLGVLAAHSLGTDLPARYGPAREPLIRVLIRRPAKKPPTGRSRSLKPTVRRRRLVAPCCMRRSRIAMDAASATAHAAPRKALPSWIGGPARRRCDPGTRPCGSDQPTTARSR